MKPLISRPILSAFVLLLGASPVFADESKSTDSKGQTNTEKPLATEGNGEAPPVPATNGDSPPKDVDTSASAKPANEPVEVSVFGRKDDALQKTAGSATLISAKEVRRTAPADTTEILRRVPGLHIRPEDGMGMRLNLGVRGLDPNRSRQVLVMEDGAPIVINPYGEPDLYYSTPVDRIRAVEVVKGSGSLLFGPQSIGGSVNFLTVTPPDKTEWTLDAQYGQRHYLKLLGLYGGSVGDGAARYVVQVTHRQGDGFRGISFGTTDILGKIAFATSAKSEATLKIAAYDEYSRSTYVGLTQSMFKLDPRRPSIAPHDAFTIRRYDATLTHEYRFTPETNLRTIIYAYMTNRAWRRQVYDREALPGVDYERIVGDRAIVGGAVYFRNLSTTRDRRYEVLGMDNRVEHHFSTGRIRHTLTTGLRLHAETADRREYLDEFVTSNAGELLTEEIHHTYALAAYAQDRIAFRNDLLITPGVRLETLDSLRHIRRTNKDGVPRDVWIRGESANTAVLPGIGIVGGSPTLNAFGGVYVGYSPPRVSSAISADGSDAHLNAEQSTNFEAGVRVARPKWLRAEVTGFLMDFRNQVISGTLASGQTSELVNGGQTLHRGVESSLSVGIGQALKIPLTIDLGVHYTFSRATFNAGPFNGNRLPYAPLHLASATLDIEHKIGLGGQIAWTYVSDQFADQNNTVAEDPTGRLGLIPAYSVFDVNLRYRHAKTGLSGLVSVKNALDQVYISSRLPDGIQTSGFRQVNFGLRWDHK